MKKFIVLLTVLSLAFSCSEEQQVQLRDKAHVQFSFGTATPTKGKIASTAEPAYVLISITDNEDNIIFSKVKYALYKFNESYISEDVVLPSGPGTYKLTYFVILDDNNNALYAIPQEGSQFADAVTNPLPFVFTAVENKETPLMLQVVAITDQSTPEDFGIVSFGFEVINPFTIPETDLAQLGHLELTATIDGEPIFVSGAYSILNIPDELVGKTVDVRLEAFVNQSTCFQKVYRYDGMITLENTLDVNSLLDKAWQPFYLSKYASIEGCWLSIYRSAWTDVNDYSVEIHQSDDNILYYGYVDRGFWLGTTPGCNMDYLELSGNGTIIKQFSQDPSCISEFDTVDSMIVLDTSCLGYIEDYLAWNADGAPYCQDAGGKSVTGSRR